MRALTFIMMIVLSFSVAYAEVPESQRAVVNACFATNLGVLAAPFDLARRSATSSIELANMIQHACNDMKEAAEYYPGTTLKSRTKFYAVQMIDLLANSGMVVLQDIPTVITADMLKQGRDLRAYLAQLGEIAKIEDRAERIRRTYELSVGHQGEYDYDETKLTNILSSLAKLPSTPELIFRRVAKTGKGGVCRDFSLLLEWSLMQVSLSPTISAERRKWGALDENSFSVGRVPASNHIWVEVVLPHYNKSQVWFDRVHLDPTWYSEFVPLLNRHTSLSDWQTATVQKQCQQTLECVAATAGAQN